MNNDNVTLCWFSCGVTSAVACYLALRDFSNCRVIYIKTGQEHEDSFRFLKDVEQWFGHEIEIVSNDTYKSAFDVIAKTKYINGPAGARCTLELKKKVRWQIEKQVGTWERQIIGFDSSERKRAQRFSEQYPTTKAYYPLIVNSLSKEDCMAILLKHHIEIPLMYRLGFHNNNCIGCVKGGKSYWALIRKQFPDAFNRMAKLERELGHSCINGQFLDELPGNVSTANPLVPGCSLFCDVDFLD